MNDNTPTPEGDAAIPESERWLHEPKARARLDQGIAAMHQLPVEADLDALEQMLS